MLLKEYIDAGLVHSIHTSERRSFRSCRRRWDWTSRQMYYPRVTPEPLEFGVAFHKAMEVFYEPSTWDRDLVVRQALALVAFKKVCDEQLKEFTRLNGEPEIDKIENYRERIKLGLNMIRNYTENISPVTDIGFRPIEVEVAFEVPILSPEGEPLWCKCDRCWQKTKNDDRDTWQGLPVTYGGRLDMLAEHIETGRLYIYDWKTTSRILDEDAEASFLSLDDQIASYVWALRYLGMPVVGFVYVEIKKSYPSAPEELTRLYKGRRFSCNKQHLTTADIFRKHVAEHDPISYADGLYDKHIEWLKVEGTKFHQRHQVHKNDHEVDEVGYNIWLEAQDITGNPRVYPQPGRFSCTTCLFRQPCIGKNQGEDYVYTLDSLFEKRTKHYYEDKEPSTE